MKKSRDVCLGHEGFRLSASEWESGFERFSEEGFEYNILKILFQILFNIRTTNNI